MTANKWNQRNWFKKYFAFKKSHWTWLICPFGAFFGIFLFIFLNNQNYIFLFLSLFFLFFIFIYSKKVFIYFVSFWLLILITIFLIDSFCFNSKEILNENFQVSKIFKNGIIINKNFDFIFIKTNRNFVLGEEVLITTKVEKLQNNEFDLFLKSCGVKYKAYDFQIEHLTFDNLKFKIFSYISQGNFYYKQYNPLILLGLKTTSLDIYEKISSLSLVHLFVISGFHFYLITKLFNKFLKLIKIKNCYIELLIFPFLIFYLYLTNFNLATLRALIYLLLVWMNKNLWKNKFSKLNLLTITMIIVFLINPYFVFSYSFVYIFIILFGLKLTNFKKYKKIKETLLVLFISSLLNIFYIKGNKFNLIYKCFTFNSNYLHHLLFSAFFVSNKKYNGTNLFFIRLFFKFFNFNFNFN